MKRIIFITDSNINEKRGSSTLTKIHKKVVSEIGGKATVFIGIGDVKKRRKNEIILEPCDFVKR